MKCDEFKESIDIYLESELNNEDTRNFENHLGDCEQCARELQSLEKCARLFRKIVKDEDPPEVIRKAVFDKCGCKDLSGCCPPQDCDK